MTKRNHQKLDEYLEQYLTERPDEIDSYLAEIFADYAEDGNSSVLLSQLRVVAKVKGISNMAKKVGISRQGLYKVLSENGNPRLENMNAIMRAMGYKLTPQKLDGHL